jgi:hypothetical protein
VHERFLGKFKEGILVYSGCTETVGYDEANYPKGFYHVKVNEKGQVEPEPIELNSPRRFAITEQDFTENKMAVRAIITDLIIIGEAVDKIPKSIKYNFRQIPWRTWERMRETRNELAHEYYNIKPEILWGHREI